jgi:hypothetical protein
MPTQFNVPAKQVDRPEVSETYGDTIRAVWFDGTWRIEVDVTRLDASKAPAESMSATQHPSCRLVLSVAAGIALLDKLTQLAKELESNGTLKRSPAPQHGVTH